MDSIDIVVSFDSTGSMAAALGQVRKKAVEVTDFLFENIPNLRIGVINHGDYCDGDRYLNAIDLTNDRLAVAKFFSTSRDTDGGDVDECYEAVLNHARGMSWTSGKNKAMILIGDCNPHPVGYRYNGKTYNLDWRNELRLLVEAGITVYPIQCLGRRESDKFYQTIAQESNSVHLNLNQFTDIAYLLTAVCCQRANKLGDYEKKTKVSFDVSQNINRLMGRKESVRAKSEHSLHAVHPARFQVIEVEDDTPIKDFVLDNGLKFKIGRGFYEFVKPVLVQSYKEVIIQDKSTGEMFSGDKAREILGIPVGTNAKVKPTTLARYNGFIQSTSPNRKLIGGTKFLYEVEDF